MQDGFGELFGKAFIRYWNQPTLAIYSHGE
jgi:hypothetical protein